MAKRETSEAVRRIQETSRVRETVEKAFQEILRREARREEIESLRTMRGMGLDEPEMMAGAWRNVHRR